MRFERAPFDHPALRVPHGHAGEAVGVTAGHALGENLARDEVLVIPAVGAAGRADPLVPFDEVLDACAGGCSEPVALLGTAAPPPDDPICAVPEPSGTMLAALASVTALARQGRRRLERMAPAVDARRSRGRSRRWRPRAGPWLGWKRRPLGSTGIDSEIAYRREMRLCGIGILAWMLLATVPGTAAVTTSSEQASSSYSARSQ